MSEPAEPYFLPGVVTARNECCSWAPGTIIYYATDGISQYRLDHPDGVNPNLSGRERAVALALLDYARERIVKAGEAA